MEQNGELTGVTFFVPGIPIPKGSARAITRKGMKRPVVVQDNKERQQPWAASIGYHAKQTGVELQKSGAIALKLTFYMPRPSAHYRAGDRSKGLKVTAPLYHTKTPDLDKLVRCVKDALTGVVWHDDSQVARFPDVAKVYGDNPGVLITISRL